MNSKIEKARKKAELLSQRLHELKASQTAVRVVFAESCTAGLVSALLGQIPGISEFLCGSAVCYMGSVKQSWLNVSQETINQFTTESSETTQAMAVGVLEKTEDAICSAAITGHLGPGAPDEIDGIVFVVVACRKPDGIKADLLAEFKLQSESRIERQYEAAGLVIETLTRFLANEYEQI